MFNVTRFSLGLSFLVKVFMPKRKTYLKLDANTEMTETLTVIPKTFKQKLFYKLVNYADVISVETTQNYEIIKRNPIFETKLFLVPNGFENPIGKTDVQKENVFLTVGTIGLVVKNSNILLEALENIDFKNWKFYFAGPIEDDFNKKINDFYSEFPTLKEHVVFYGAVYDKEKLADLYKKQKSLFCRQDLDFCCLSGNRFNKVFYF